VGKYNSAQSPAMSSFRRSRTGTVCPTWREALDLANTWSRQLNRRHRVRSIDGRAWKVERSTGRVWRNQRARQT
jgi:hypothetical protein